MFRRKFLVFLLISCCFGITNSIANGEKSQAERAKVLYEQGIELQEHSQLIQAIEKYKTAINLNPQGSYAYALGTAYQSNNEIDSAVIWYQKAVVLAPDNKVYLNKLRLAKEQAAEVVVSTPLTHSN